jgi:hypothetical protein
MMANPKTHCATLAIAPIAAILAMCASEVARAESRSGLTQVTQDFTADPHWKGLNNRVVGDNCPTIHQDFGWLAPDKSRPNGTIGGTIWRSRTPAYYATKVGPYSFDDQLSASGLVTLPPANRVDGFYFGFFNAARQEWRPWSSVAVRIGELRSRDPLAAEVIVDYMSQSWKAGGYTVGLVPVDGKPHRWRFSYEPNMMVPTKWPDPRLRDYIGTVRRPEVDVFKAAEAAEPGITIEQVRSRLREAAKLGLIIYQTRRGEGWEIRKDTRNLKGRILFQIDDAPAQPHFLDIAIRNEPATFDRFGVFNFQLPGGPTTFALSNLSINGKSLDLSLDPHWESNGNHKTFVEQDFHAKQNFGYSKTNFAGKSAGEIGGTFWRTEPIDPLHGYYADDIGALTLDDPISFSGHIAFTAGATDAGMMLGYFNASDANLELKDAVSGAPMPQTMVLAIEGPTRIGYQFSAQLAPTRELSSHSDGPIFVPRGDKHPFSLKYDPAANKGVGRITMAIDDVINTLDLTPQQRAAGTKFNRFGMLNIRRGGKYVTVYLDDLTYTTRHPLDYIPAPHEQQQVHVSYPENGRKY